MNLYVLQNHNDQNSVAFTKFKKADLVDNTSAYVKSKLVKSSISQWNEILSEKLGFPNKSSNSEILVKQI